jgi:hypothetical protein
MSPIPFRNRSKAEIAKETLSTAATTATPLPGGRTRKLVLAVAVALAGAAAVLLLRRLLGSGAGDIPEPDVGPAGSIDERPNDPAPKAKVGSEPQGQAATA